MKAITVEQIKELAEKGLHQAEIARQLDCSRENIRQRCNKHGIQTVKYLNKSSQQQTLL